MESIRNYTVEFDSPGDRLNHILDKAGFRSGRGRVTEFQSYLAETSPELFKDLKYGTVKSWFQQATPTMRRIGSVLEAVEKNYPINQDISLIKTWWKVGGYYPFAKPVAAPPKFCVESPSPDNEEEDEKLQFIAMSLVIDETGELFKTLSSKDLVRLKDKALRFAKEFADPSKSNCPSEYLRMVIKYELESIKRGSE